MRCTPRLTVDRAEEIIYTTEATNARNRRRLRRRKGKRGYEQQQVTIKINEKRVKRNNCDTFERKKCERKYRFGLVVRLDAGLKIIVLPVE